MNGLSFWFPICVAACFGRTLGGCGGESDAGQADNGTGATSGSSTGGGSNGGGSNGGDSGSGSSVGPGDDIGSPGDPSWLQAFAQDGVGVSCESSYEEMKATGAPSIEFGETEIFVGFQQYGDNQDPVFRRFDAGIEVYCEHHEQQSPDGRALGITWNGGPTAFVVYTIVGGGTDLETAAQGGWMTRYGDGGASSKVTVIGEVEVEFGSLRRATFVVAKKGEGYRDTNSVAPAGAITVLPDGNLELVARSAFTPLNPDLSPMCDRDDPNTQYPNPPPGSAEGTPSYVARFTPDLSTNTCGTTWSCGWVKAPCPEPGAS